MTTDDLNCLGNQRLAVLRGLKNAHGIDSVYFRPSPSGTPELLVVMTDSWSGNQLAQPDPKAGKWPLSVDNIVIEGGRRIRDVQAILVHRFENDPAFGRLGTFRIQLNHAGDPSSYRLRLIESTANPGEPPPGFDCRLVQADFRFCNSAVSQEDCAVEDCPPADELPLPPIDYMAKDYASFRKVMLDRLSQTIPQWMERNPADLGVTLVEALAYHADHLSYFQDAIGTEAYLQTARRRLSVRRHARLVDYQLHEGCNSRTWMFVEVNAEVTVDREWAFYTSPYKSYRNRYTKPVESKSDLLAVHELDRIVFEPMTIDNHPIQKLYPAQNSLSIYTWCNDECCLPAGATSVTLVPDPKAGTVGLQAGDLLLFEEVLGPHTGLPQDANPSHRHIVRLTRVRYQSDFDPHFKQPGPNVSTDHSTEIIEVTWDILDALPFALCICTGKYKNISVARGNMVLVDQGLARPLEPVLQVPAADESLSAMNDCQCRTPQLGAGAGTTAPRRFQSFTLPALADKRLTHATPFPDKSLQARTQARQLARWLADASLRGALGRYLEAATDTKVFESKAHKEPNFDESVETILTRLTILLNQAKSGQPLIYEDPDLTIARETLIEFQGAAKGDFAQQWPWSLNLNLIGPASADLQQDPQRTTAAFALEEYSPSTRNKIADWKSAPDLLSSGVEDRHFVLEIDDSDEHGSYQLRFGDGRHGMAPWPGSIFQCQYREGGGLAGNVGPEAIREVVDRRGVPPRVVSVRNPFAASGGVDPEPTSEARVRAPQHFRAQLVRAVTAEDYAWLAKQDDRVQQSTAFMCWTGAGYEVQVAVDLLAAALQSADSPLQEEAIIRREIDEMLQRYRRIGHDVRVVPTRYVPLQIELEICVKEHARQGEVRRLVREALSNRVLAGGQRGFFHPDRLTFGTSIDASEIIAEVQAVSGVDAVKLVVLRRLFGPEQVGRLGGTLSISPVEIARLDNDPAFPENGRLVLNLRGGR